MLPTDFLDSVCATTNREPHSRIARTLGPSKSRCGDPAIPRIEGTNRVSRAQVLPRRTSQAPSAHASASATAQSASRRDGSVEGIERAPRARAGRRDRRRAAGPAAVPCPPFEPAAGTRPTPVPPDAAPPEPVPAAAARLRSGRRPPVPVPDYDRRPARDHRRSVRAAAVGVLNRRDVARARAPGAATSRAPAAAAIIGLTPPKLTSMRHGATSAAHATVHSTQFAASSIPALSDLRARAARRSAPLGGEQLDVDVDDLVHLGARVVPPAGGQGGPGATPRDLLPPPVVEETSVDCHSPKSARIASALRALRFASQGPIRQLAGTAREGRATATVPAIAQFRRRTCVSRHPETSLDRGTP